MAGTQGPTRGKEWQENIKYTATPIFKGLVYNNIDKLQGLGALMAPEFAPEIALAGQALVLEKIELAQASKTR